MKDRLRVLFAGTTGVGGEKDEVLLKLRREVLRHHPEYPQDPNHEASKRLVNSYCVEEKLKRRGMETFLVQTHEAEQRRLWRESFLHALDQIDKENPNFAFLSIHLTFQRQSRFFSPLAWEFKVERGKGIQIQDFLDLIKELRPDYCVTPIDDIYGIWKNIKPGSYLRLREIMTWRMIEILMADALAKLTIPHEPDFDPNWQPYRKSVV